VGEGLPIIIRIVGTPWSDRNVAGPASARYWVKKLVSSGGGGGGGVAQKCLAARTQRPHNAGFGGEVVRNEPSFQHVGKVKEGHPIRSGGSFRKKGDKISSFAGRSAPGVLGGGGFIAVESKNGIHRGNEGGTRSSECGLREWQEKRWKGGKDMQAGRAKKKRVEAARPGGNRGFRRKDRGVHLCQRLQE